MKKIILFLSFVLVFLSLNVRAAKITSDELNLGRPGSSADKVINFGPNRFIRSNETTGELEFSNDGGLITKKIGSGSGSGSGGGINLISNSSLEDGTPPSDWTNSGGTFTKESFTNSIEGDASFGRFVATGAGQYVETDLQTIPDDFTFGMMADVRYASSSGSWDIEIVSGSSTVIVSSSLSNILDWDKAPTVTFPKPSSGSQLKMRLMAKAAGQIDFDKAYLGSNKGFVSGETVNVGSARIQNNGTASIISQQNDFIDSVNRTGLGVVLVTFKSGVFTVPPSVKVSLESGNIAATFMNPVNISTNSVEIRSADNGATFEDKDFSIVITKQGADAVGSLDLFASSPSKSTIINSFSARIESNGTVTNENVDWINGNCTESSGQLGCALVGTLNLTTPLACSSGKISGANPAYDVFFSNAITDVNFFVRTDGGSTATAGPFYIHCQKQESDFKLPSLQLFVANQVATPIESGVDIVGCTTDTAGNPYGVGCSEWISSIANPATEHLQYILNSKFSGREMVSCGCTRTQSPLVGFGISQTVCNLSHDNITNPTQIQSTTFLSTTGGAAAGDRSIYCVFKR